MKLAAFALGITFLTGCPSKDNTSSSGATAPSVTATVSASASASATPAGPSSIATLDASKAASEAWTASEGGAALPILYWSDLNVRLSAGCKQADGSLGCAALTQLKSTTPLEVKGGHGSMSMGTRICLKLGNKLVRGKNPSGSEDGFCQFPDSSLVSTGTLEQYTKTSP